MDKKEFSILLEEINTLIANEQFAEAAEIANNIDWRRVRNFVTLHKISDLYKANRKYEEALEIILMAYERKSDDKSIVYSICELYLEIGNLVEALQYLAIYNNLAKKSRGDIGGLMLQYKVLECQEADVDDKIELLEEIDKRDYREEWAYELAYQYHRGGYATKCIETCDKLITWFGESAFAIKAMELKMLHAKLTPKQQAIYDKRYNIQNEIEAYESAEYTEEKPAPGMMPELGDDDFKFKTIDMGNFNTINLQKALADSMKELLGEDSNDEGNVTRKLMEPMMDTNDWINTDAINAVNDNFVTEDLEEYEEVDPSANYDGAYYEDEYAEGEYSEDYEDTYAEGDYSEGYEDEYAEGEYNESYEDEYAEGEYSESYEDTYAESEYNESYEDEYAEGEYSEGYEDAYAYSRYDNESYPEGEYEEDQDYYETQSLNYRGVNIDPVSEPVVEAPSNDGSKISFKKIKKNGETAYLRGEEVFFDDKTGDIVIDKQPFAKFSDIMTDTSKIVAEASQAAQAAFESTNAKEYVENAINFAQESVQKKRSKKFDINSFDNILAQENDGQISLALPKDAAIEKQITGQINLDDVMNDWENLKKRNREKQNESIDKKIKESTGKLFEDYHQRDRIMSKLEEDAIRNEKIMSEEIELQKIEDIVNNAPLPDEERAKSTFSATEALNKQYTQGIWAEVEKAIEEDAKAEENGEANVAGNIGDALASAGDAVASASNIVASAGSVVGDVIADGASLVEGAEEAKAEVEAGLAGAVVGGVIDGAKDLVENVANGALKGEADIAEAVNEETANEETTNKEAANDAEITSSEEADGNGDYVDENEYADEYEGEYEDEYADEYEGEYEDEYADEYEGEYEGEYADEYEGEYEGEYADEYEGEYEEYADEEPFDDSKYADGVDSENTSTGAGLNTEQINNIGNVLNENADNITKEIQEEMNDEYEAGDERDFSLEEQELFSNFLYSKKMTNQILQAIDMISLASYVGNVIITGDEGTGVIELSKSMIKELQLIDSNFVASKVAKISGVKLNRKDIPALFAQLSNGALIIEKSNDITKDTLESITRSLENASEGIIVILTGSKKEVDTIIENYPIITNYFNARIDITPMNDNALVDYAKKYAYTKEYKIDEERAILALHQRINELQIGEHNVTIREIEDIVDEAIEHSSKFSISGFFNVLLGKKYDFEDMVILQEKDFGY